MIDLDTIQAKEFIPGFFGKPIHSERTTQIYWRILKDSRLPEHHHEHEQVVHMLSGTFELVVNGQPVICEAGSVFVIPSNVVHSGRALTDCRILDVFCPVREDYKI